ncbi:pyroglutamyl-peptidase I [Streptomyces sp. NBC_01089]|uniref:pyroglutamyl-peptidase I n=1 Tax=Streptomyces sp. NBC_01089 TaxID=2903747 RepID=UPI00386CF877|nr:pyroglutamyl-peptidase I [Streptomyces sp. NBC_01089]WSU46417.1 pyroglutamyl-peptidase I [Streptomyces sp. NBC_01089]
MTNSLSSPSEATVSRVLLTGVEPFGRNHLNSAWEACRLLAKSPPQEIELEVVLLPCAFGDSIAELRKQMLRLEPDLVISTGQGGSRPDITIERVAINLNDAEGADNNGNQPIDEPIVADGPAAYFSSIPVKACTESLLKAGIPASVSHTAGTFLCNHIAFGLAHLIATEFPHVQGGFVHIPFTPAQAADRQRRPSMASTTAADALRIVISTALRTSSEHSASSRSTRSGTARWFPRRSRK